MRSRLVGVDSVVGFEGRPGIIHPPSIPGIVLLEPEDKIQVFSALLYKEEPFLEILET